MFKLKKDVSVKFNKEALLEEVLKAKKRVDIAWLEFEIADESSLDKTVEKLMTAISNLESTLTKYNYVLQAS